MRKYLFLFLLGFSFSLSSAQPVGPALERAIAGKVFSGVTVQTLSQQSYKGLMGAMERIPSFIASATTQTADISLLTTPAFQVQITANATDWHSASGFAMQVQDKVYGFMAAHVALNIREAPFIKVSAPNGEKVVAPIEKWYIANPKGSDLAVFEIPDKVKDLVTVLKPSPKLLEAGNTIQITGFNRGSAIQIPQENILFASPQRYLVQHSHPRERTGMCGSPLQDPATGEVVGVYIGYEFLQEARLHDWFYMMPGEVQHNFTDLHFAVPIQNALTVAKAFEAENAPGAATEMKVLGHTVAPLHPHEYISSVQLLRNGIVVEQVHRNVFLNPEKLEEFFYLQENDVLRITVSRPQTAKTPTPEIFYDINVSTGEVTSRENNPRRIF